MPLFATRRRDTRAPLRGAVLAALLAGAILTAGCGKKGAAPSPDAGADAAVPEIPVVPDGGQIGLAVDFTVSGCPLLDLTRFCCAAVAPVTLTFVPVTSPDVGTFFWDFGDGSARTSLRTPTHTFSLPGSYDVTLTVAAASDSASRTRTGFVVVEPAPVGAPCDGTAQCDAELACLCPAGAAGCPAAFQRGLCTSSCTSTCSTNAACVDLARSAAGDQSAVLEAWRASICLQACALDADCAPGLRCRWLPVRSTGAAGWTQACFVDALGGIGASCRDAAGVLRGTACLTGNCTDLGALGLCTESCSAGGACPPGAACARLGDGRSLCLHTCAVGADCGGDPLLACEMPGAPGDLGFAIPEPASSATACCAPRHCTKDADCGLVGLCKSAGGGGHCVPA